MSLRPKATTRLLPVLLLIASAVGAQGPASEELRVLESQSVFAVVTHKGGMAAGLAHNHLIAADGYKVRLTCAPDAPETVSFEIELDAFDLLVDDPTLQEKWYPRLELAGILDEPFKEVSSKDRDKIRASMLGPKQLDAREHPKIHARLVGLVPRKTKVGDLETSWLGELIFEVKGRAIIQPVVAAAAWNDGRLEVEAVTAFTFSDFDIKPFSAMLGAVKNRDQFHVYVRFMASP